LLSSHPWEGGPGCGLLRRLGRRGGQGCGSARDRFSEGCCGRGWDAHGGIFLLWGRRLLRLLPVFAIALKVGGPAMQLGKPHARIFTVLEVLGYLSGVDGGHDPFRTKHLKAIGVFLRQVAPTLQDL
jgi:hypothetical protein